MFLSCRNDIPMYDSIDSCLRNENGMVIEEAAATVVSSKELRSSIDILQIFISLYCYSRLK
jgi:hypothetical protein